MTEITLTTTGEDAATAFPALVSRLSHDVDVSNLTVDITFDGGFTITTTGDSIAEVANQLSAIEYREPVVEVTLDATCDVPDDTDTDSTAIDASRSSDGGDADGAGDEPESITDDATVETDTSPPDDSDTDDEEGFESDLSLDELHGSVPEIKDETIEYAALQLLGAWHLRTDGDTLRTSVESDTVGYLLGEVSSLTPIGGKQLVREFSSQLGGPLDALTGTLSNALRRLCGKGYAERRWTGLLYEYRLTSKGIERLANSDTEATAPNIGAALSDCHELIGSNHSDDE